jgi:Skp family chaperone for outer membrane proteins
MTNLLKAALLGTAAIAAPALVASPAYAQNRPAAAPVVATADVDAAVQQSAAFTTAIAQMQTTYAPQITARNTRAQALEAELRTLQAAAVTEQNRQPRNAAAYQAAVTAFQTRQNSAQQEMRTLSQPIDVAIAYVREQITLQLAAAVRAATTARRVDVLLNNEAVIFRSETADMTSAIVTELNRLVPTVQIVPPAGYEPGALLRAQQAQAAGQPAAPGAPATPTPTPPPAQPQTR